MCRDLPTVDYFRYLGYYMFYEDFTTARGCVRSRRWYRIGIYRYVRSMLCVLAFADGDRSIFEAGCLCIHSERKGRKFDSWQNVRGTPPRLPHVSLSNRLRGSMWTPGVRGPRPFTGHPRVFFLLRPWRSRLKKTLLMIDFVRPKVICEKADRSDIPDIDKKKYLVPADLSTGEPGTLCHLATFVD